VVGVDQVLDARLELAAADLPSLTTLSLVRRTHAGIRSAIGTAQVAKAPAVVADLKRTAPSHATPT
jgi:hypothetical protein